MSWKTELIEHLRQVWKSEGGQSLTRILKPNARQHSTVRGDYADQRTTLTASVALLRKETLELNRTHSLVRETHLLVVSIQVPEETEVDRLEIYQAKLTALYQNQKIVIASGELVFAEAEEWAGEPVEDAQAWEAYWKCLFYRDVQPI